MDSVDLYLILISKKQENVKADRPGDDVIRTILF